MASTGDTFELSDVELKQILEKFKLVAWNSCEGASIAGYMACARLLKLGHLNRDLELGGMQTGTKSSNFLACVAAATDDYCIACFVAQYMFNQYLRAPAVFEFVKEYQRTKDVHSLQQMCNRHKQEEQYRKEAPENFRRVRELIAEVYARYITTRGASHNQVIEALATVRKETLNVEAAVRYFTSSITLVDIQLDQICEHYLNYIPKQILVKLYIYSAFVNELARIKEVAQINLYGDFNTLWNASKSTQFGEHYLQFEAKCQSAVEILKAAIGDGEKRLQEKLYNGIP